VIAFTTILKAVTARKEATVNTPKTRNMTARRYGNTGGIQAEGPVGCSLNGELNGELNPFPSAMEAAITPSSAPYLVLVGKPAARIVLHAVASKRMKAE
jgi:hypothetical protein